MMKLYNFQKPSLWGLFFFKRSWYSFVQMENSLSSYLLCVIIVSIFLFLISLQLFYFHIVSVVELFNCFFSCSPLQLSTLFMSFFGSSFLLLVYCFLLYLWSHVSYFSCLLFKPLFYLLDFIIILFLINFWKYNIMNSCDVVFFVFPDTWISI